VSEPTADKLLPVPASGRTFSESRLVRFGDLSPGGRLRLDALARYFQDVSSDDTADAGLANDTAWVVRRTAVEVHGSPTFREPVTLTTFCSGIGGRWAERRVSLVGAGGASIESASLWVHLDPETGRPTSLGADFHDHYEEAAAGRTVSARLQHDANVPVGFLRRRWSLRFTDFDLLGHVNNAATWAMVEEVLASRRDLRPPFRAELEYRLAIERDDQVELAVSGEDQAVLSLWVVEAADVADGPPRVFATGRITSLGS
jgi:acyl-ACP thioesterase